jgi:glycosyltransferase involved in cell wall biosynthesis
MKDIKVSIIIPCFNQAPFLTEAVHSVLAQSYSNWECIIINDGSTDNTEEVAKKLIQNDNRFIYRKQNNKGLPGARNSGLEICSGDFIQFLDADDALHPQKLEKHLRAISVSGLSKDAMIVSYSRYYYSEYSDIYKTLPGSTNCSFLSDNPLKEIVLNWENKFSIAAHSYFFSANIFFKYGIRFDEEIATCEDIDCWIRIFQLKPCVLFLDEKLAYYRYTPGSMSKNLDKVWRGHVQVMEKHMALSGKKSPLYKWARYKKNEVLFRYKKIGKMDWLYKLYFSRSLFFYYRARLLTKLHLGK